MYDSCFQIIDKGEKTMSIMEVRIGQENQKNAVLAPGLFYCVTRKTALEASQFTYLSGLQFTQREKEKERQKERYGDGAERECVCVCVCVCVCYIINIFFFLDQSSLI